MTLMSIVTSNTWWATRNGLSLLLVLTAACQSKERTAQLLRLQAIDHTLMTVNDQLLPGNEGLVESMQAQVERNQRMPADTLLLWQAQRVHGSARALVTYLRDWRHRLSIMSVRQGKSLNAVEQLDAVSEVAGLLRTSEKNSGADSITARVNAHAALLQPWLPVAKAGKLVLPAPNFAGATVAGALAQLAESEARVLMLETDVLNALYKRMTSTALQHRWQAMATAETNSVAPGATYRAQLFLADVLSTGHFYPMKMAVNGRPIPVDSAGIGQVLLATATSQTNARREAVWEGRITFRRNGRDSTFRVRVPYTILPK